MIPPDSATCVSRTPAVAIPSRTAIALLAAFLILAGCAGSSEGTGDRGDATPATGEPAGVAAGRQSPEFPPGKFTVQLGAFQSEAGAATVASLAKSRFSREVYSLYDERDGLYKVMLGVFDTKDLARSFRDSIVRQFPQDYRDAWVSDLAR